METEQIKYRQPSLLEYKHRDLLVDIYTDKEIKPIYYYFKKHKVGIFSAKILIEMGLIKALNYTQYKKRTFYRGTQYKWIAPEPTIITAVDLVALLRTERRAYAEKYKTKKDYASSEKTNILFNNLPAYFSSHEGLEITNNLGLSKQTFYNLVKNENIFSKYRNTYTKITNKKNEFEQFREKVIRETNNKSLSVMEHPPQNKQTAEKRDLKALELKKQMDKKEVITETPELKSKRISLFWGMFKFEINK